MIDFKVKLFILIGLSLFLNSCSRPQYSDPDVYLVNSGTVDPYHFILCHGNGCPFKSEIFLKRKDWDDVKAIFSPQAQTAKEERNHISKAIGLLEQKAGKQSGTTNDQPTNVIFYDHATQLDCIDETINTMTYLRLLNQLGLIHFHTIDKAARRGYFLDAWPHNTAVIKDKKTSILYAVDSWYGKNGDNAHIVDLKKWRDGWSPS